MIAEHIDPNRNTGPTRSRSPRQSTRAGMRLAYPSRTAALLQVSGDIDTANVHRFDDLLTPRLSAALEMIVVDLSAVRFLGIAGVDVLRQAYMRASANMIDLRVAATGHEVVRALLLSGIPALMEPYPSARAALNESRVLAAAQPEPGWRNREPVST